MENLNMEKVMEMLQNVISSNNELKLANHKLSDELREKVNNTSRSRELSDESKKEFKDPSLVRIHLETRMDPRMPWVAQLIPDPDDPKRVMRLFPSFEENIINYNRKIVKTKNGEETIVDYSFTGSFPRDSVIQMQTGLGRKHFLVLENGECEPISGKNAYQMAMVWEPIRKEPIENFDTKQSEEDAAIDSVDMIPQEDIPF